MRAVCRGDTHKVGGRQVATAYLRFLNLDFNFSVFQQQFSGVDVSYAINKQNF
jgi:Na+/H+ antiporter NhaC